MKLAAKDLTPGLKIPAPQRERKWLKTPLTVLSVSEGYIDAKGPWLNIVCSFLCEEDGKVHPELYQYRPSTLIRVMTE
jgi:hypothetical protein